VLGLIPVKERFVNRRSYYEVVISLVRSVVITEMRDIQHSSDCTTCQCILYCVQDLLFFSNHLQHVLSRVLLIKICTRKCLRRRVDRKVVKRSTANLLDKFGCRITARSTDSLNWA